jgi:hypothetical protein
MQTYGLAPAQISLVPPAISCEDVAEKARAAPPDAVRAELGLRPGERLIGGAGFVGERKGVDLFVEAARHILQKHEHSVRFVWIGNGPDLAPMRRKLRRAGLHRRIRFVGPRTNPYPLMAAMDVLLVPSRDDPMPRVMLEAALLGVPAIAFEPAGGAREFLAAGRGVLIPKLCARSMGQASIRLLNDVPKAQEMARAAGKEVRAQFNAPTVAHETAEILEEFAMRRPARRPHFVRPAPYPLPERPQVSAVVTSYNTAAFISDAIESVFAQTHPPREIVVVDDGSEDDSAAVLESLAQRAPLPMRVLRIAHGGQGQALNTGIANTRGDLVCTLDGDDVWRDIKVERIVALAKAHPEAGLFQHQLETNTGQLKKQAVYEGDLYQEWLACREVDVIANRELVATFLPTSALAWRRSVLDAIGPVPPELTACPDAYLTRAACCFGPVAACSEILGAWRDHGQNASHTHANFRNFWLPVVLPAINSFFHKYNVPVRFVHNPGDAGAS